MLASCIRVIATSCVCSVLQRAGIVTLSALSPIDEALFPDRLKARLGPSRGSSERDARIFSFDDGQAAQQAPREKSMPPQFTFRLTPMNLSPFS